MKRLIKSPLLQLMIIGAALALFMSKQAPPETIEITENQLHAEIKTWLKEFGTTPSPADQHTIVSQLIDEEVLYRAAKARKFDQLPVVERRLVQLVGFLQLSEDGDSDEKSIKLARRLGLDESDPMVRRYMVNSLRELIAANVKLTPPTQQTIAEIYQDNIERYTKPATRRISHIYISGMDEAAKAKAQALLTKANQSTSIDAAIQLGDAFYGGHNLPLQSEEQLARRMGNSFAEAAFTFEFRKTAAGTQWQGPALSSYGYHLINISFATEAQQIPLADVRKKIVADTLNGQRRTATAAAITQMREQYEILVPNINADDTERPTIGAKENSDA